MTRSIVPEGETDADRIRDFVEGYQGRNRENRRAAFVKTTEWVLASEIARRMMRARRNRRGR